MRHNDYPTTLLMEPAANDEPARYRMTPAASTRARKAAWEDPTSAELTQVMDYLHSCNMFNTGNKAGPGGVVVPITVFDGDTERYSQQSETWREGPPPVPGVYIASVDGYGIDADCHRHWDGRTWSESWFPALGQERKYARESVEANTVIVWLRLIKADTESASGAALIGTKTEPEAEVWHTEAPTVAGVYVASTSRDAIYRRHWDGKKWSCAWEDHHTEGEIASAKARTFPLAVQWLRLIEADTPAPAAQESAKPLAVYRFDATMWRIGKMFYRCDADGWIAHTPTADAVCPVPSGVKIEAKFRTGCTVVGEEAMQSVLWCSIGEFTKGLDIVAWRPIQA